MRISSTYCQVFPSSTDSSARHRNEWGVISEKIQCMTSPSASLPSKTISSPTLRAEKVCETEYEGEIHTHVYASASGT
jgi:hypothetical protein